MSMIAKNNPEPPQAVRAKPHTPRLLLIGTEGLEHWRERPGFDVVGIVDSYGEWPEGKPDGLSPQLLACPLFVSVAEALASVAPDIACMSVPSAEKTDHEATELLLRAGIDVMAKKLRLNAMSDVNRLRAAADAGPGRLYVGEFYRYMPSVRALKRLLDQGKLGAIEQITWRCLLPIERYDWMSHYRHLSLEDLSYHHFSVLHDLFGFDPVRVYAHSYAPSFSQAGTRTVASMLAETANYRLNYETVWCSKRKPFSYLGEVTFEGSHGSAVLTDDGLRIYSPLGRRRSVPCPPAEYDGPWGPLDHWLEARPDMRPAAQATVRPDAAVEAAGKGSWLPYTFERFEPVLRTIYRAVESAETHTVQ
ncbi:Gfo/Idh/MocA family oxidoreductase [Paenibacillus lycopersici]|uniref:Gfo/Idh/MocA family oxidoreductase n=1 Tax=Paenibacillus lycopersici TaxID=2704462 RepID=A0A6C0G1Q8_9BACL|nr:Gfo/Idh/MocA family oxidoreductase [Paenibacillus lycopersici]QHT62332.1 Gfo/Idh/MocA family oxidoreductase [Paenibacillus lycopersici]